MMELVWLFRWTLPAGMFFAGALALLGCQLSARDRAMQTVCVSQGAMLGVLLALGFSAPAVHDDPDSHVLPFLAALLASAATFLGADFLARRRMLSKNTLFAALFSVLLAAGYFVSALFPALESHMAQVYFGDLATITETDAKATLALGLLSLLCLWLLRRPITGQSFALATFGAAYTAGKERGWTALFNLVALSLLCFSVQFLGFLFTVAMLFLPTTVLGFARSRGLDRHLALACGTAIAAAAAGFVLSLRFTRFPTVPTVTLSLLVLGACVCGVDLLFGAGNRRRSRSR